MTLSKRNTKTENQAKINELLADKEDLLTDWESRFLNSINSAMNTYGNLTIRQEQVMEEIVDRVRERELKERAKD